MVGPDIFMRLLALVPAFTLHEAAHALVADWLGDRTPRSLGRLTLNPIKHVDLLGLVMLLVFGFGWAKPVPVNPYNFRVPRRRGMLMVAAAGPLTNIILALIGLWVLRNVPGAGASRFLELFIIYNAVLAVFNLIPVPPLDGSRILAGILPAQQASVVEALEQYGWVILVMLLWTGVIDRFLRASVFGLIGFLDALVRSLSGPGL